MQKPCEDDSTSTTGKIQATVVRGSAAPYIQRNDMSYRLAIFRALNFNRIYFIRQKFIHFSIKMTDPPVNYYLAQQKNNWLLNHHQINWLGTK